MIVLWKFINLLALFYYFVCVLSYSVVSDSFATPWTVAHKAPLPTEFFSQEYWSGLPCPSPWDLPDSGVKPRQVSGIAGRFFTNWATREAHSG